MSITIDPAVPIQVNPSPSGPASLPSGWWRSLAHESAVRERVRLPEGLDRVYLKAVAMAVSRVPRTRRYLRLAQRVLTLEDEYGGMRDGGLRERAAELRGTFRRGREKREHVTHALAVLREMAWRVLGMRPYAVQVAAGWAMHEGCVAEMATGEGKTLAATLAATLAGWRGRGCHIITVNDYLAARDAREMAPLYEAAGLSVAGITAESEPSERRAAYAAGVTYLTNKEAAADFLRDRLTTSRGGMSTAADSMLREMLNHGASGGGGTSGGGGGAVMRGLESVIVDEADSVLIDEAVTPLIISGDAPNDERVDAYQQASDLAGRLEAGQDFRLDPKHREANLTRKGRSRLADLCSDLNGLWSGVRRREELVTQALAARHLYERDRHYVVQEDAQGEEKENINGSTNGHSSGGGGNVVIVDEFTGRLMPDRTWRDGLHAAVEAKERLTIQPPKVTLARVSFQRFFRRYRHLAGMTGTAREARAELWATYGTPTVRIPTHRPCVRRELPGRVFATLDAKREAVVDEVARTHAEGRPVLVGSASVRESEEISRMLHERGLPHAVLNAVRHAEEAQVVARAGERAAVTIATNMAGRGTDIKLGQGVAALGGLHVIATTRHEARRVDRQLAGRAARQGDPGSAIAFASLEDDLLHRHPPLPINPTRLHPRTTADGELTGTAPHLLLTLAQRLAQHKARTQRDGVLRHDQWLDDHLGFAGAE